jgi:hypothetical protein
MLQMALILPQTGCGAGWRRIDLPPPASLPARQQVQVWQAGMATRLHAVSLSSDSVSGVPYLQPIECDSCRVTLALQAVDSIRSGNPTAGFWKTVGLTLAGLAVGLVVICATGSSCQFGD